MKTVALALLCLLLAAPSVRADLFEYSISGSDTDPWDNQPAPQAGFYDVYVWLSCTIEPAGCGAFSIVGSLTDRILGVEAIPPLDVADFGNLDIFWSEVPPAGGLLAPIPLAVIHVFDPTGTGGTLCLTGSDLVGPFPWAMRDCLFPELPAAVWGFASDGTTPCTLGFCDGPVGVEDDTWGRVKSLYR